MLVTLRSVCEGKKLNNVSKGKYKNGGYGLKMKCPILGSERIGKV